MKISKNDVLKAAASLQVCAVDETSYPTHQCRKRIQCNK